MLNYGAEVPSKFDYFANSLPNTKLSKFAQMGIVADVGMETLSSMEGTDAVELLDPSVRT